jgi:UDP-N-acetylmuramate--alanine ligase
MTTQRPVHFVGIGGVGMSGLARILHAHGHRVSGSDLERGPLVDDLGRAGIPVAIGHRAENVPVDVEMVVASAAIRPDHPEIQAAGALGVPVLKYAQALGRLMARHGRGIAIAGTHGKTTTTAMIAHILVGAGLDPTLVVGGSIPALGGTSRAGAANVMIAEACEYDRSFLNLAPTHAVVTNIEPDHLDYYRDLDDIRSAFRDFASAVPAHGAIVVCGEDRGAVRAVSGLRAPVVRYGIDESGVDWRGADVELAGGRPTYLLLRNDEPICGVRLAVPGRHNVLNSLAAIAIAVENGVAPETAARLLGTFTGVNRRFQVVGEVGGASVVDDYAHHPTEISTVIRAARERYPSGRVIAVFQPHQHSRTRQLLGGFASALRDADAVLLPDIYSARDTEADKRSVSAHDLVAAICGLGGNASHGASFEAIARDVRAMAGPGDVVLTMGAGDVWKIGRMLAQPVGGPAVQEAFAA